MHASRQKRKTNERRRAVARLKQEPLPLLEQLRRAELRRKFKDEVYPEPPVYRDQNTRGFIDDVSEAA